MRKFLKNDAYFETNQEVLGMRNLFRGIIMKYGQELTSKQVNVENSIKLSLKNR